MIGLWRLLATTFRFCTQTVAYVSVSDHQHLYRQMKRRKVQRTSRHFSDVTKIGSGRANAFWNLDPWEDGDPEIQSACGGRIGVRNHRHCWKELSRAQNYT